jgi:hypothetical protein
MDLGSISKKLVIAIVLVAGAIVLVSQAPSRAHPRGPNGAVTDPAIGWQSAFRELAVGP